MSELLALLIMIVLAVYVVWPFYRLRSQNAAWQSAAGVSIQDLHYQKRIATEIIQDLHFDHQTGKLGDEDHQELVREQEGLISRLTDQLNKHSKSSNDLSARLESEIAQQKAKLFQGNGAVCPGCGKSRPQGAKFCPQCGAPLA